MTKPPKPPKNLLHEWKWAGFKHNAVCKHCNCNYQVARIAQNCPVRTTSEISRMALDVTNYAPPARPDQLHEWEEVPERPNEFHCKQCGTPYEFHKLIEPCTTRIKGAAIADSALSEGVLEVNYNRGVIYFHNSKGETTLRVCGVPREVLDKRLIDVMDVRHSLTNKTGKDKSA